uniref:G2/mitotic-specific cyclin-B3 n=1 Tax=Panagrolaimus superbus TaxID=310955 RepID=A0A914XTK1_9BILA
MAINWLIYVQQQFQYYMPDFNFFSNYVLHLSIKLFDVYLCRTKCKSTDEPLLDDIVYMCEDNYTADDIIMMELFLFKTVGYSLGIPFPYRFLKSFAIGVNLERHTLMLARYILETSLMFYPFIGVKDDLLAASSMLLALRMKNINNWNENLIEVTGYTEEEVEPIMKCLNHMMIKRHHDYEDLDAAHEKYSKDLYLNVAQKPAFLEDDFNLTDPIGPPQSEFTSFRMPFLLSPP